MNFRCRYMVEILPIWHKALYNQLINNACIFTITLSKQVILTNSLIDSLIDV